MTMREELVPARVCHHIINRDTLLPCGKNKGKEDGGNIIMMISPPVSFMWPLHQNPHFMIAIWTMTRPPETAILIIEPDYIRGVSYWPRSRSLGGLDPRDGGEGESSRGIPRRDLL